MLRTLLVLSLSAPSQADVFNYYNNGVDWTDSCNSGARQSPIDIETGSVIKASDAIMAEITYQPMEVEAEHLPYTYEIMESFGGLMLQNRNYTMLQFHFHSPSEHTINGVHYDLEMHIVHKADDDSGTYTVIGMFFEADGTESAFMKSVIDASEGKTEVDLMQVLGYDILTDFYFYDGSFTTPGCSELVSWIVLDEVKSISPSQLSFFSKMWINNSTFAKGHGNYRETSPLNGRVVIFSEIEDSASIIAIGFAVLSSLLW